MGWLNTGSQSGSQSGVQGPPGVLEGVPGGPQQLGALWVCNSESVQMEELNLY